MSKQSRLRRAHKKKQARKVPVTRAMGSRQLLRRMSREHLDVLQNIEWVLVTSWRGDAGIDDAAVDAALVAAMKDDAAQDARVADMLDGLVSMRQARSDVPARVWHDALLTVLQSVRRHSARGPGQREYLRFASQFVS